MAKEKINKSRRRFMILSAAGGGALVLGLYVGLGGEEVKDGREAWGDAAGFKPNAWLRIDSQGLVTVRIKHCEMGQGTTTGLSMVVAEELDMPWDRVRFEIAPVESVYKNPAYGAQMTGGSTATPYSWDPLRRAAASAREMLIAAAAADWKANRADCRAESGRVKHLPTGRTIDYADLSEAAAKLDPPDDPPLKRPTEYKLIGRNLHRLDAKAKISGEAVFGQDVKLPGAAVAYVIHPPVIGARLASFQAEDAAKRPGVVKILPLSRGLAVVAKTYWQAAQAAEKVKVEWTGGLAGLSSQALWAKWRAAAKNGEAKELYKLGDPEAAFNGAAKVIEAEYRVPWQAHATPEPMNCTAWVEPNRCRLWVPTQNQDGCQEVAARLCGLGYDQVEVSTTYVGGGYGRRNGVDYALEAVELSKALGRPIKVMWSREEDMASSLYRPASLHRMRAGLDRAGAVVAWSHRIVGPSDLASLAPILLPAMIPYWLPRGLRNVSRWAAKNVLAGQMAGRGVLGGAGPLDYGAPNVIVDYIHDNPGLPCGFWRGVSHSVNAFPVEGFMDELAVAAGRDPVELRLSMLKGNHRLARVIRMVAPKKGEKGAVAAHVFHGASVAMRAAASLVGGEVRVDRVKAAVDCGRVINPRIVKDQIAGGIAFGLSAALKSEITFSDGRIDQANFDDFPIITMEEMPEVEVDLVVSAEPPLGIGEAGVPPIAPAVAAAVRRATGRPIRSLPIRL